MTPKSIIIKFIVPVLIFVVTFFSPLFNQSLDLQNLLNVASLLFVIMLGFFIAAATSNYLSFQTSLAEENSALIGLHNLVKLVDPLAAEKVADIIDHYVIETLDYKLGEYADNTQKEFAQIIYAVDEIKVNINNPENVALFSYVHEVKINLLESRQKVFMAARKVVGKIHWTVLILLALVIEFLLLSMRDGSLFLSVITAVITIALYLVLVLLREVDSNVFLEEQLAYGDPQKVFEAIGKLPYFPETGVKYRIIQKPNKSYRVGLYEDYPK